MDELFCGVPLSRDFLRGPALFRDSEGSHSRDSQVTGKRKRIPLILPRGTVNGELICRYFRGVMLTVNSSIGISEGGDKEIYF